jgi:hypothetical protein
MSRLSKREQKIIEGIVQEWTNKKIAGELGMSEAAVRFELSSIFHKCVSETLNGKPFIRSRRADEAHAERVIRQFAACQSPHETIKLIKKIKRSSRGLRK